MAELSIVAKTEKLEEVLAFVDEQLEQAGCTTKVQMQIDLAVEEIFVNISKYAYNPEIGWATINIEVTQNPLSVKLTFADKGVPYDPLKKEDPDVTLSAQERNIGGLGIFLVKKNMDDVCYEYKDGQNILSLRKEL